MDGVDAGLLILRVWLGVVMVVHGWNHARSIDGTASWFASKGFRHARLHARMSALGEIAIGVGLAVGLLTSFSASGLIATMAVAYWSIHRTAGFFVFSRPDEGYEYVATLAVGALVAGVAGPGAVSIDGALGIDSVFDGWVGLIVAIAGLAAAAAQLKMYWSAPSVAGSEGIS